MRHVIYAPKATKYLGRLPKNDRQKIKQKIAILVTNPDTLANNISKMQGQIYNRLRVGKWRIKFTDDGVVVDIVEIMPRGKDYKP